MAGNIIPGLTREAFHVNSSNGTSAPTLIQGTSDGTSFSFEWSARGTSVYVVKAKGSVIVENVGETSYPRFSQVTITCTCPDGLKRTRDTTWGVSISVCKHAGMALSSVADKSPRWSPKEMQLRREAEAAAAKKILDDARKEQETRMPGERLRLEEGLDATGAEKVFEILKRKIETVEGLDLMAKLFDSNVLPKKQKTFCLRCKDDFDCRYSKESICRINHPMKFCNTEWEGSKKSWEHCYQCDTDFNFDGFNRHSSYDNDEYCFEGEHTTDQSVVDAENEIYDENLTEYGYSRES